MSPRAQGPVWSGAGLHHQAAHANIPSRSSLRAYNNGEIFQPRTEWRIGDRAFSVAAPRVWNRLPTELKLFMQLSTFRRHLKSVLFRMAYDVMHLRADCRRRTTNSAVTVTAGLHEFHSTAQHERYATCSEHFLLNNSYCRCCGPATGVNNELAT